MYLIREVMYCKPGQVKPMVQKFQTLAKVAKSQGLFSMRVLTDACAERFWTVVMEVEAESIDKFEETIPEGHGKQGAPGGHEGLPRPDRLRPPRDLPDRELEPNVSRHDGYGP